MGSYLPSATAKVPEEDPSINSTGGGRRLLKASKSLEGLHESWSSPFECEGEKVGEGAGYKGDASIAIAENLER